MDPDLTVATSGGTRADAAPSNRRQLLAATLAGLATTAVLGRTAVAADDDGDDDQPNQPTDADVEGLTSAVRLELAARDLYRSAVSAVGDDLSAAVSTMAESHEAFAQAIAGDAGLSAGTIGRDDEVYTSLEEGFGSAGSFATTAHTLEQTAVSTHTALLADYESADAISLTTAILLAEARHATVLADIAGVDDPETLFTTTESALSLSGGA